MKNTVLSLVLFLLFNEYPIKFAISTSNLKVKIVASEIQFGLPFQRGDDMSERQGSTPQDVPFAKLAETSTTAITRVTEDGSIVYENKRAEEALGLKDSEKDPH